STGTTTIQAGSGGIALNNATISTNATTVALLNTTATTVNAFQAGTSITIGATTGTTNIRNALSLGTTAVAGSLLISDGSSSTITLKSATQVAATNYDITIPAITASDTVCLQSFANCSGSGVTTVGAIDTPTTSANGAHISGSTIYLQTATGSVPGLLSTTTQSLAGDKTLTGNFLLSGNTAYFSNSQGVYQSEAFGSGASVYQSGGGTNNVAVGYGAIANAGSGVAIGSNANASTTSSGGIAIGDSASSTGGDSVIIGHTASGTGEGAIAIGYATSVGYLGIGIGYNVSAGSEALNIGNSIYGDLSTDRIAVGTSTTSAGRLTVDNSSSTDAIFVANDNGSAVFTIADGGNITVTGNILGSNSATATTATTSGTGTNTTTLTFTGTTSFANNDIIFIDNAGQDYYTRIVSGGTAASVTVSPAVTFEATRTVTKYQNVSNLGATASDYTTQTQRLFQGYFLGGVVTGAGSTTLSDRSLMSSGELYLKTNGENTRLTIDTSGNVGLGTSPVTSRALTVNGLISTTAGNRLQLVSSGNTNLWNFDNSSGTLRIFREDYSATGTGANGSVKLSVTNAGDATFAGNLTVSGTGTSAFSGLITASSVETGFSCGVASSVCASAWFRSSGTTGWYNSTYSLGLYAVNSTELDTYNSADLDINGGDLYVRESGTAATTTGSSGNYTRIHHNGTNGYIDATGQLIVRPGGAGGLGMTFDSTAGFTSQKAAATSATNLCQDGLGFLRNCTPSSIRYKNTITNMVNGLQTLRQLRPVNYYYNHGVSDDQEGILQVGFIAEEVAAVGGASYVLYNQQGQVETLQYSKVTVLNSLALKELDVQVQSIDARLSVVESGEFSGNIHVASDAQIDGNLTVAGDAELNNLSVTGDTTVANLTVNGKIITAGATPTVVLGANTVVGQNGTVSIEGNDTAGTITYTSGTKNMPTYDLSSGAQATVTFSSAYGAVPRIALTAKNQGSASVKYYVDTTTNGFVVHFLDAPTASTTFTFDYLIIQ
ncbi:tail fiber domain-containing protein, partial [Candidatus Saccharibacteria bacterium]|nr:tail fiber domain-containing protein [Candidatus Saccharibacteria bacterium]